VSVLNVDFNARTADDRVRLDTIGAAAAVLKSRITPGTWAWLTDGEVRVGGQIQQTEGGLVARVAWETIEFQPDDESDIDVPARWRELQGLMREPDRDHRKVLGLLPFLEREFEQVDPGRVAYFRARALQALGYPHLALLAIDEAVQKAPHSPAFRYQWLELLKVVDFDKAVAESARLVKDPEAAAVVIAAFASIHAALAHKADAAEREVVDRNVLATTERFGPNSPGWATVPASTAALVHLIRGFALLRLKDRPRAMVEFTMAIASDPSSGAAHAARGIETYPAPQAVEDLENAVRLGPASYWPAYYLTHDALLKENWHAALRYSNAALALEPSPTVRANLLEWRAIARFQEQGDFDGAESDLEDALKLAPENTRLTRNLKSLRQMRGGSEHLWDIDRDAVGNAQDERVAA
jgi:tetratricopeptide (TPR) repeat protein